VCFVLLIAGLVYPNSIRANAEFSPIMKPTLSTVRAGGPIKVDGDLSDAGWVGVGRVRNFVERSPGENTKPDVRTEAFITYDDGHLYAGFICYDDPDEIRATMSQRDQFQGDDMVGVMIDTYGEASWAYELFVNPHGVQKDMLWTMVGGEDSGYDLIWESAAQITDSGYQVEIAVPFSSMRFPGREEQTWRVEFWRNRPRDSRYQYSWGADDRNEQCFACKWGTLYGIRDVSPGKGFEILPTIVGRQSGYRSSQRADVPFDNEDPDAEFSLGGKYSISSSMTAEGYYNPDFSQVEADAAQIDVNSTISLLFPERRPFFQEGADLFRTYFNSFYTRTVWNPQYAAKFTARTERNSLGFMSALDENSPYTSPFEEGGDLIDAGESYVNVLRGLRTFGNGSQGGFMVTDRRLEKNGSGSILSLDGRIRLTRTLSVIGQVVGSHTKEPDFFSPYLDSLLGVTPDSMDAFVRDSVLNARERFDHDRYTSPLDGESYYGHAMIGELRRFGRSLSFILDYNEVSPSYRTQTGYDPWNNQRNSFIWSQYTYYPGGTLFERISPEVSVDGRWNFDGARKWRHITTALNSTLRVVQGFVGVSYTRGEELWSGRNYDGLWTLQSYANGIINDQLGIGLTFTVGRNPALSAEIPGDELSIVVTAEIKPIDRITIEPTLRRIQSKDVDSDTELFRQLIGRGRLRVQLNPQLSLRLVVQYNDLRLKYRTFGTIGSPADELPNFETKRWDFDPLVTYRLSPFSVFYVGSTYDYHDLNANLKGSVDWGMTERHYFMKLQYLFQI